jgi:cytochrome c-type biogenesis protein
VIEFGPEAFATAFAAGFLSFTSPCVLPLVPGYLSYVSGVAVDELGAQPQRVTVTTAWFVASPQCSSPSEPGPPGSAVLLAIYALVLGVPFLAFGLAFTRAIAVVGLLHRHWRIVYVASGAVLVLFGVLLATELTEVTSRLARFSGVKL